MTSLIMIVVSSALVSNVVLNQFLGICSFLGVSKQIKTSASLGAAVIFVITIASAVASLLYDYVLAPLNRGLSENDRFHSGYCCTGTAGRDVPEENLPCHL